MEKQTTTKTKSVLKPGDDTPFKVEELTPEQTGAIDLHLKGSEDLATTIKNEVAKFNAGFLVPVLDAKKQTLAPEKKIEILKKLYSGLTINGIDDKEGYKKADDARKIIMKLRTRVSAKHKDLKDNYLKVSRALDGKKNELTDLLLAIEEPLKEKLKAIDELKDQKEREEAEAKQKLLDGRVAEIKANGMNFDGSFYSIGETLSVDIVTLGALPDEQFTAFVGRVKVENERLEGIKAAELQRQKEEREEFEQKQRDQLAEQNRLKEAADQIKRDRAENRIEFLKLRGFEFIEASKSYRFQRVSTNIWVSEYDVMELDRTQWDARAEEIKQSVAKLEAEELQQKAAENKRKQDNARILQMTTAGFSFNNTANSDYPFSFYINTPEYGWSNIYSLDEVISAENFEEFLKEATDKINETLRQAKVIRDEKTQLDARTKARISELINGFGHRPIVGGYARDSKYSDEPELLQFANVLTILEETITGADESEWDKQIKNYTVLFSQIQQAEQAVKVRKDAEAETERLALLSEADQVKEYILKLQAVTAPTVTDSGFKMIVDNIGAELKISIERFKLVKPD